MNRSVETVCAFWAGVCTGTLSDHRIDEVDANRFLGWRATDRDLARDVPVGGPLSPQPASTEQTITEQTSANTFKQLIALYVIFNFTFRVSSSEHQSLVDLS